MVGSAPGGWNSAIRVEWVIFHDAPSVLLTGLLAPSGAKGVFQTPQTFATPQPPHSDPSTVSLNSSLPNLTTPYCSRAMAGSTPTASTPFSIPQQPFNCPSPFPSSVDPAQFIWAVSSRLPTVEESSPNDERSTIAGPSPNVGADSMVKAKRPSRKTTTSPQEKIVKVTWWRPHGQTAITPGTFHSAIRAYVCQVLRRPQAYHPQSPRGQPTGYVAELLTASSGARSQRDPSRGHLTGRHAQHPHHATSSRCIHGSLWLPAPIPGPSVAGCEN